MKKIGITTLNGYFNYGNRLQNYALQETLKTLNYNVETIWIESKEAKKENTLKQVNLFKYPSLIAKRTYRKFFVNPLKKKRKNRIKQFSNRYIKETKNVYSEDFLPTSLIDKYDYFVTGSDQVWNPHYMNGSALFFLTFAPKGKRIAYSPSFGVSEIPNEYKKEYKESLNDMTHLSVREEAGAQIIEALTGREAPILVDPTLILNEEKWLKIAKPASNKPQGRILLTYFLGPVSINTKDLINRMKKKHKMKVVNLANPKYKNYYLTNPAEFLDYINSSTLFITDSFHGAVFSILFKTPFVVTDRVSKTPTMNSRIKTLLSKFELEDRHINDINEKEILSVDFAHTFPILEKEREKAFEYLKNATLT